MCKDSGIGATLARLRQEAHGAKAKQAEWAQKLTPEVQAREAVLKSAQDMVGKTMTWTPSGPGSNNDFVKFLESPESFVVNANTSLNCWEFVLLSALGGQVTNPQRLQSIYEKKPDDFARSLIYELSKEGLLPYPQNVPAAGDSVFFDGLDHVAIATGKRVSAPFPNGGAQIVSFWPAPEQDNFGPGAKATVALVTIEQILEWCRSHNMAVKQVTIGPPDWNALNS